MTNIINIVVTVTLNGYPFLVYVFTITVRSIGVNDMGFGCLFDSW